MFFVSIGNVFAYTKYAEFDTTEVTVAVYYDSLTKITSVHNLGTITTTHDGSFEKIKT